METFPPKIIIEPGSLKRIPQIIKNSGDSFIIVTDSNLKQTSSKILESIRKEGLKCHMLILPPGEKTKSLSFVEKISKSLIKLGAKRDSCLIGVGGGVIGDLSGFIASIYMRGINFVSVPTTLLAMADSCVGGKTGIDLEEGKNLLGTFYNPKVVIIDPDLLKSLPDRDFRAGISEIVKHAVLASKPFFNLLEKQKTKILKRDRKIIKKILSESIKIKLSIVKADEKESIKKKKSAKSRMLLNYGHTVGHAIEKLSGFKLPHGEAVAIGMVAENRVAVGKKIFSEIEAKRVESLLKSFSLPVKIPSSIDKNSIKKTMESDKKNLDGRLLFALPQKIGQVRVFEL